MDKQTTIGIILIIAIFVGFQYFTKPSPEEIAERKRINDSITNTHLAEQELAKQKSTDLVLDSLDNNQNIDKDSVKALQFGLFANVVKGDTALLNIENDVLKLKINPKGGFITYAELKNHKTHDSLPLIIFENAEESNFVFLFQTSDNRVLSTKDMFFTPQPITQDVAGNTVVKMRLDVAKNSYIDYIYTITKEDYKIDFDIVANNMEQYFAPLTTKLEFTWLNKIRQQERSRKFENRYVTLNYMYEDNDMEKLSPNKDDLKSASTPIMWFAAKDQFFSTIILNKKNFLTANMRGDNLADNESRYLKSYTVNSVVNFDPTGKDSTNLEIFLVPNRYKTLKSYNDNLSKAEKPNLQKIIPLGWVLFRWVSQIGIIPLFNFLSSFLSNWGLIILIVTLIIKLVLLPLTYKSYMSSAKMRVLKPQLDEINAKIPEDKMMERQQAQMNLYKSVGVSPMGGCLPMLLQMPILIAVFMYLPSAIELRQQSFLWATDLSSYDVVPFLSWNFNIPLIGNHISIFCLLMTVTNIIYTKINMDNNSMGANQQMAMMKWMMYLMPVIFFFMFNEYASGLTYYYFISLLLTILQTYLFRLFVDDEKLLQKLELAKQTKKTKKKSGFMARLEEAQKMQQKRLKEQQAAQRKKR